MSQNNSIKHSFISIFYISGFNCVILLLKGVSTAKEVYEILSHRGWQVIFPLFTTVHEICIGQLPSSAIVEYSEQATNFSIVEGLAQYCWIPKCIYLQIDHIKLNFCRNFMKPQPFSIVESKPLENIIPCMLSSVNFPYNLLKVLFPHSGYVQVMLILILCKGRTVSQLSRNFINRHNYCWRSHSPFFISVPMNFTL